MVFGPNITPTKHRFRSRLLLVRFLEAMFDHLGPKRYAELKSVNTFHVAMNNVQI